MCFGTATSGAFLLSQFSSVLTYFCRPLPVNAAAFSLHKDQVTQGMGNQGPVVSVFTTALLGLQDLQELHFNHVSTLMKENTAEISLIMSLFLYGINSWLSVS